MRRTCLLLAGTLVVVSGCGLTSGSPMVDDVSPGTVGRGEPSRAPISPSRQRSSPSSSSSAR